VWAIGGPKLSVFPTDWAQTKVMAHGMLCLPGAVANCTIFDCWVEGVSTTAGHSRGAL